MENTNDVDRRSGGTACYAAFRHLLGERVQTKDGVGVLVGVKTPCNGLYYRPEIAELMVWYPPDCGNHLSSWTYKADEVKGLESSAACDDCGGQTVLRTNGPCDVTVVSSDEFLRDSLDVSRLVNLNKNINSAMRQLKFAIDSLSETKASISNMIIMISNRQKTFDFIDK